MAENDDIASKLNNLFGSDLFKENNFIKIYKLLGITNIESPEPAPPPAPPPAPAEIDNILRKFNYNYNNNILSYDTDTTTEINIFNDSKNLAEIIKEFIQNISVTDFNVNKGAFKTKILNSIIIGDIVNELGDNDIIVDPAGLNYMKGEDPINDANGLSYILYNYIKGTGDFKLPDEIHNHFLKFDNVKELFINNKDQQNALYYEYKIENHKPTNNKASNKPQVEIKNTIKNLKLIHAIGPNYNIIKITDIKDEYKKFMVLYNDIFSVYIHKINDKNLRLPLHSTGLFSGGDSNMNYILICLALAYLYIYCKINEGNKDKVKIYYLNDTDGNIDNFKKILQTIIELITK